eukprot:CAMPEP_0179020280 /NCGR_PEP_ID=MMETSP0796-20121207/5299_1 /TAXON_ID=73915 /ORGANISM="Pyrodinium bahamense, Strain pbaha01" /LENGTH=639 /DNA_ID=CAMNT_0020716087 /DNA_START=20 /DNA_END=1936 /DNA_ORIENTATION=+
MNEPLYVDRSMRYFPDEDGNVSLPAGAAVQGGGVRSILCWINTWQTSDYCLVATGSPRADAAFNLVSYRSKGRFIGVMLFDSDNRGKDFYPRYQPFPVNDGKWHLIGAVYDESGTLTIFVDGEPVSTKQELIFNTQGASNLVGQSNHAEYENRFFGAVHGLWIYGRALSSDEVKGLLRARPLEEPVLLYREKWRPQFHFSAEKNWLNDPNGLVHFQNEYHLFFQHNPHGIIHGNMSWGHAVSNDLLHWRQLDHALLPDEHGTVYSGCAVVDWHNTGGFADGGPDQEPCLVALFTSAGKPFTQSLAHSSDRGRTWKKMHAVVPHICRENRDPKVFWHAQSSTWIMALYLEHSDYALLGSSDLKRWEMLSELKLLDHGRPDFQECPDFFELPVQDSDGETRWVFWGGGGLYFLGSFDGRTFTKDTDEPLRAEWGNNGYAAQTYSDAPGGRRIQMSWMRWGRMDCQSYPGMPFNQQMSFPVELSLIRQPHGVRLRRVPIEELKDLHVADKSRRNFEVSAGQKMEIPTESRRLDLRLKLPPSGPPLTLMIFGKRLEILRHLGGETSLSFDGSDSRRTAPLCCHGKDATCVQVLVDTTSVEIFDLCGEASLHECFLPDHNEPPIALFAPNFAVAVEACEVYELR